jgi:hypothetical protein
MNIYRPAWLAVSRDRSPLRFWRILRRLLAA